MSDTDRPWFHSLSFDLLELDSIYPACPSIGSASSPSFSQDICSVDLVVKGIELGQELKDKRYEPGAVRRVMTRELTLHPEPPGGLTEETESIKHARKRAVRAAQEVFRP
jgi:hypothetical protein